MAIISCSECGAQISDKAAACAECGCPITKPSEGSVEKESPQPVSETVLAEAKSSCLPRSLDRFSETNQTAPKVIVHRRKISKKKVSKKRTAVIIKQKKGNKNRRLYSCGSYCLCSS